MIVAPFFSKPGKEWRPQLTFELLIATNIEVWRRNNVGEQRTICANLPNLRDFSSTLSIKHQQLAIPTLALRALTTNFNSSY